MSKETIHSFWKLYAWLTAFSRFSIRQNGNAYSINEDIMPFNLTGRAVWVIGLVEAVSRAFLSMGFCPKNKDGAQPLMN